MKKRWFSYLVLLVLVAVAVGCGSPKPAGENKGGEAKKTAETGGTVTFAYIAASVTSPQALINQKEPIFADGLQQLGKKVNFVTTRSLDKVWPLMDKEKGAPDFVFIPAGNFGTYVTKTSKFGGSDKYVIIAGSFNNNGSVIIAKPSIKTLKDLDGKTIAIANQRYVDEFQMNKVLATAGLKSTENGGTVKYVWEDIVPKMLDNWGQGKYDAISLYAADNFPIAMAKVQGSYILSSLNPNKLFGENAPRYWLITKKELLQNNPELVKEVLKAHVLSTEKAISQKDALPGINRDMVLKYYEDNRYKMDEVYAQNKLEAYEKRWKPVEITYDPNPGYCAQIFDFLSQKGLVKDRTVDSFIRVDLLNQVLAEMGKPPVK